MNVSELRKQIDAVDDKIIRHLNRRAKLVLQIGKLKKDTSDEVYVPSREKKVLAHVRKVNKGPLSKASIIAIYREIMSGSLALEQSVRVAYLGPPSTFTHEAARSRFGGSVLYVACETISDIFSAVKKNQADYGVVPIENSTEGAVTHTLDEFVGTELKICAEIYLQISHHLLVSGPHKNINRILSNPQVFGQCRNWLRTEMPGVDLVPVSSTARAAEIAAREKGKGTAAIASALAAEMYRVKIIAADIQDMSGNMTRFLVIGKAYGRATGDDKSSIMFAVKHQAGSLYRALGSFKKYGINMTKIESRPSRLKAWEYLFFIDIEGHVENPKIRKALRDLEQHCVLLTILGAYPRSPEAAE